MDDDAHPEGLSRDKFAGDKWVPVPLKQKVYDKERRSYKIVFESPKQLLLNPEFEAMVHDELLRNAHRDGLEIEGQVMVTTEEAASETTADETQERDAQVREVLVDPSKEAEVEEQQRALGGMSEKEMEFRRRMRQNVRETADEAFGFVSGALDGKPITEGAEEKWKIDRKAFMEGFFGDTRGIEKLIPKPEVVTVTAEALVAADLGSLEEVVSEIDADEQAANELEELLDNGVPDDLSGWDDIE